MSNSEPFKFQMLFSEEELQKIEDYRYSARIPTRAAAVRALITAGLEATATKVPAHGDAS